MQVLSQALLLSLDQLLTDCVVVSEQVESIKALLDRSCDVQVRGSDGTCSASFYGYFAGSVCAAVVLEEQSAFWLSFASWHCGCWCDRLCLSKAFGSQLQPVSAGCRHALWTTPLPSTLQHRKAMCRRADCSSTAVGFAAVWWGRISPCIEAQHALCTPSNADLPLWWSALPGNCCWPCPLCIRACQGQKPSQAGQQALQAVCGLAHQLELR